MRNDSNCREELILLSGQVINGMLSADSSIWTKLIDRTYHKGAADAAVSIAKKMLEKIDEICGDTGKKQLDTK